MYKAIRICSKGTVFVKTSKSQIKVSVNWWGCWPSGPSPEVSLTDTGWHSFPAQILTGNMTALSALARVPCEHRTSPSGSTAVQGVGARQHPPVSGTGPDTICRRPYPRPWAHGRGCTAHPRPSHLHTRASLTPTNPAPHRVWLSTCTGARSGIFLLHAL